VHQGTRRPTLHLREFSEGSAIIHRTVRCTTGQCPVPQGRATLNSPASGIRSAIIHRTCPVHTGLSGEPAEQRLLPRATVDCNALNARQRTQRSRARAGGTPDSLQDLSGAPPDSQAGPQVRAPRSEPNGLVTWLAHQTLSGGAPDCPVRHATAASTKWLVWWLGL
jgi:hypothetical protein